LGSVLYAVLPGCLSFAFSLHWTCCWDTRNLCNRVSESEKWTVCFF